MGAYDEAKREEVLIVLRSIKLRRDRFVAPTPSHDTPHVIHISKRTIRRGMQSDIVEKLKRGETVQFRPHGNSMTPIIKSGQLVTLTPVIQGGGVEVGDAVFCKVGGRTVLHKVTALRGGQYQISNAHGHVNGWTMAKNIFGKLTKVEP